MLMLAGLSLASPGMTIGAPVEVNYAGFALSGRYADLAAQYPFTFELLTSEGSTKKTRLLDDAALDFFRANKRNLSAIDLRIGNQSASNKIAVALVMMGEGVSNENLGGFRKIVVNLAASLVFLDFESMTVLTTLPILVEYVDAERHAVTRQKLSKIVEDRIIGEGFSILGILKERLPLIRLDPSASRNFRISAVHSEPEARDVLSALGIDERKFLNEKANRFTDILSSQLGVGMLPYAKDAANARMSLSFSDARVQDFIIPSPSYSVDLTLRNLVRQEFSESSGEKAFLYGAYLTIKVFNQDSGRVYWEKKIKHGVVKAIPDAQVEVDEVRIFSELIDDSLAKGALEMRQDKRFREEVMKRCKSG